jgi:hypothetical protein
VFKDTIPSLFAVRNHVPKSQSITCHCKKPCNVNHHQLLQEIAHASMSNHHQSLHPARNDTCVHVNPPPVAARNHTYTYPDKAAVLWHCFCGGREWGQKKFHEI